jgi:hypothetical protein
MRLGQHLSDETKAKISLSQKGKRYALGCHRIDETKAKLSESHRGQVPWSKGRHLTDEHKMKLSTANKGKSGHPQSLKTQAKISATLMGHPVSLEMRAKLWKGGGIVAQRKIKAKRRTLGFVPINDSFLGCEGHHLDNERVVYIPKTLHHSIYHNVWTGRNMDKINALA